MKVITESSPDRADQEALYYLAGYVPNDVYAYIKKRLEAAVEYEKKWSELVETTAARIAQGTDSKKSDPVQAPAHYTQGKIQVIEAMQDLMAPVEFVGHLKGCIFKYLFRYQHKGHKDQDLQKMQTYSTWLRQYETEGHITILPSGKP